MRGEGFKQENLALGEAHKILRADMCRHEDDLHRWTAVLRQPDKGDAAGCPGWHLHINEGNIHLGIALDVADRFLKMAGANHFETGTTENAPRHVARQIIVFEN